MIFNKFHIFLLVLLVVLSAKERPQNHQLQPKNWQQIIQILQKGTVEQFVRSNQVQEKYLLFTSVLKQSNIKVADHIKLNIFGRSGSTQAKTYFIKTFRKSEQFQFKIFLQCNETNSSKWLRNLFESQYISEEINLNKTINENDNIILFTPNDFPYYFESGIQHWVFWSNRQLQYDFTLSTVKSLLGDTQSLVHVNPTFLKSVPQIYHAHIFINEKMNEQL